mmetsp:Transcript_5800/g.10389  ORF Transcript_5800/g.10389 Transcript_5800/m.10389 type:complete len:506 (+) Transcript_5800:139-1656(+)
MGRSAESQVADGVVLGESAVCANLYKPALQAVKDHRKSMEEAGRKGRQPLPPTEKHLHYLHGKTYDLREFYESHPGGPEVLKMTAGLLDATPLFESYHAFADRDGIMKRLEKYKVKSSIQVPQPLYGFEKGGFYDTVTRRVREHFGAKSKNMDHSLTKNIKPNAEAWVISGLQVFFNLAFYALAFFFHLPTSAAMVCAFLAGFFQIGWGFTAMHDSSHFGLGARNHWLNETILRGWCSYSLWNGRVWMAHHFMRHHSFTGHATLDPDLVHALPMIRKHPDTSKRGDNGLFIALGDTFGMPGWTAACAMLYSFLPGMWVGQVKGYAVYIMGGKLHHNLWGLQPYSELSGYSPKWWETAIYFGQIAVQIQRYNPWVTLSYVLALNIFYAMCIVADHDLLESAVTNHVDITDPAHDDKVEDWGAVQVRNTTNFVNDRYDLFASFMGSINYQIEHHLFPGISHVHLPHIAPIVQQTCKEFKVPYVTYPSLIDAWYSFVLAVRAVMTEKE